MRDVITNRCTFKDVNTTLKRIMIETREKKERKGGRTVRVKFILDQRIRVRIIRLRLGVIRSNKGMDQVTIRR